MLGNTSGSSPVSYVGIPNHVPAISNYDAPADATAEAVIAWRGRALRVEEQLLSDMHKLQRRVRVAAAAALITAEALPERLNTPLRALMCTLKHEPDSARRSVALQKAPWHLPPHGSSGECECGEW